MIIRKGDIIELWIDKIAFGGSGIARFDGFVIFVKDAIPGDRVVAQIIKKRKDYANAKLLNIIEPSLDRIKPPCPYSGYCGGCQLQHLNYERQLEYKREHVIDSMSRIGSLRDIHVHDVIPSENIFGYRNKMEFSFSDRRWLPPEEFSGSDADTQGLGLGLHVPGTFYKVLDIDACLLQQEAGNQILKEVKKYVIQSDVPAYSLKEHTGFWRFLVLRHSRKSDEWMVNLVTSEEKPDIMAALAEMLSKKIPNIKTIVNNIHPGKAAVAVGERETVISGGGYFEDVIGKFTFRISANSFFQTNTLGVKKLYDKVLEYADLKSSDVVLDLYCGTGTIPVYLSRRVKEIIGMEIAESAVRDAKTNCQLNGVGNCRFILGDIRKTLPTLEQKPDILIIDPPRAGIHKDVLKEILKMDVERIVYVSCNPTTMARDIAHFSEKYKVLEIQPVDMFPHTYHIESVAKLMSRAGITLK